MELGNPKELSPLTLAFVGDAVFELKVRELIVKRGNMPASKLHKNTVELVNASAQYKQSLKLDGVLTEEEIDIFKRGRNVTGNHIPKNVTPKEYRAATGLETLFGYLFLKKDEKRIKELFKIIIE